MLSIIKVRAIVVEEDCNTNVRAVPKAKKIRTELKP
jgi:hypothetical protein